jgi:hypothetical protein
MQAITTIGLDILLVGLERCHAMIIRSKSKICFLRLSNWLPSAATTTICCDAQSAHQW